MRLVFSRTIPSRPFFGCVWCVISALKFFDATGTITSHAGSFLLGTQAVVDGMFQPLSVMRYAVPGKESDSRNGKKMKSLRCDSTATPITTYDPPLPLSNPKKEESAKLCSTFTTTYIIDHNKSTTHSILSTTHNRVYSIRRCISSTKAFKQHGRTATRTVR